ncbi:dephospho-CoA kinase [Nakamurella panacisegetis]|uniref:Dephospho-CoA kinase n=1 Tax=Nakamurella panacisegetis TaxID=1090615 RepID=A0A1H0RPX1_9ACTN|nr:dephospho-CoA kinase [Nakamurella panacisegetis]SDP31601.1 dephospho-CoA kinase [Nakamurella panacisegetis]
MTITVAVTGGIGAGKSTVAGMLAARGAVVVDSDRLAREVVGIGTPGLLAIEQRFGSAIIAGDGSLDRAALAAIVFADAGARKDLEGITHPLVRARFEALRAAAPPGSVVVNDIPLVTNRDVAAAFHLVVGVRAPDNVRVARLIDRGLTEADARARMATQIDDELRRSLCDVWIDNGGSPVQARRQTDLLWSRLVQFAANVDAHRVAPDGDGSVVAYRPEWPLAAALLSDRIERVIGAGPVRHVGPTSRPGQPAIDCIELEVGVVGRDQVESWAPALAEAGFPRRPDAPEPAPGRLDVAHGNADPGRSLNLYFTVR